jgi:hypothetical protein|tara:strand:+ start:971 stop:1219 length:249 start_codon:yes stop_codon:yes gene_type:complete
MQTQFSFVKNANAVANYEPQNVNREGDKLWFNYVNKAGVVVSAFYEYSTRSFKSVVKGAQYGEGVAIRNLVAQPVIEGAIGK